VSLEPDSCVRRTESIFERYGVRSLLVSKFVPGLAMVAPPLAGSFGMGVLRFLLLSAAGAFVYTGTFAGLGYLFSTQLEMIAERSLRLGEGLVVVLGGSLAAYVLGKYWQRRRFVRGLRTARITPEELKERLDAGEEVFIVDLRHLLDVEADPQHIPGAVHLSPDHLDARHTEIPRDRDIVLYCT
jgi:membrane protein DedA with SNARE-associated domain